MSKNIWQDMIGTHVIQLICVDQSFEPDLQLFLPLEGLLLSYLQCLKILSHHLKKSPPDKYHSLVPVHTQSKN